MSNMPKKERELSRPGYEKYLAEQQQIAEAGHSSATPGEQKPSEHLSFGVGYGFIVTATNDGSIPLNAKALAKIEPGGEEAISSRCRSAPTPTRALSKRCAMPRAFRRADCLLLPIRCMVGKPSSATSENSYERPHPLRRLCRRT
jgi:hypothetical protein